MYNYGPPHIHIGASFLEGLVVDIGAEEEKNKLVEGIQAILTAMETGGQIEAEERLRLFRVRTTADEVVRRLTFVIGEKADERALLAALSSVGADIRRGAQPRTGLERRVQKLVGG